MDSHSRIDSPSTLSEYGLEDGALLRALNTVLERPVDDADIYFEHVESESISLEEGLVKKASRSVRQGVGIRAVSGERTGYAHTDDVDTPQLITAARTASAIATSSRPTDVLRVGVIGVTTEETLNATAALVRWSSRRARATRSWRLRAASWRDAPASATRRGARRGE